MPTPSQVPKVTLANADGEVYTAGTGGGLTDAELRASAVPVDTELPAAAALSDTITNPTVTSVATYLMAYDRWNARWARVSCNPSGAEGISGVGGMLMVHQYLFDGTNFNRSRTATKFVPQNTVAVGAEATVWTPAAGKKFRLMGGSFSLSAAASIIFKDNTAGTTIFTTPTLEANVPYNLPVIGNGILSATINNVLTATSSAAANLIGTIWGTEE